jgi:hypothetical protein
MIANSVVLIERRFGFLLPLRVRNFFGIRLVFIRKAYPIGMIANSVVLIERRFGFLLPLRVRNFFGIRLVFIRQIHIYIYIYIYKKNTKLAYYS